MSDYWALATVTQALFFVAFLLVLVGIWVSIKDLKPKDKARVLRAWGACLRFWPRRGPDR